MSAWIRRVATVAALMMTTGALASAQDQDQASSRQLGGLTFIGERYTLNGSAAGRVVLWDLTLTNKHIAPHAAVAFDIRNIFNRAYADPGAAEHAQSTIPQVGRTFDVRTTWRF